MSEPIKLASLGMIIPALVNPVTATIAVATDRISKSLVVNRRDERDHI